MRAELRPNVLMVDDDENDALLIRHMVSKMPEPGCHFHWTGSYDQGIKSLTEINWDVCLVDYGLGARNGVQMITESRARGVDCPFLLVTGAGSRTIDLQAMQAGVKGYLEKSRLCPLELERAIRYAMAATPPLPGQFQEIKCVPSEAAELVRYGMAARKPFVVIALVLDYEACIRSHLTSRELDRINERLEAMVKSRICETEALFRTSDGGLLVISSAQESREARQFLAATLADPMAVVGDIRGRSLSLPAIVRRNVFASSMYPDAGLMLGDVDAFLVPGHSQSPATRSKH
jgi:DNA-binding NarL/FixJ family response regulator